MERKFTLWLGIPFLAVLGACIAIDVLAPGLIGGGPFTFFSFAIVGVILIIVRAIIQILSGESAFVALHPIAAIIVTIVLSFDPDIGGISRALWNSVTTSEPAFEGVRFSTGDDGRFHPRADINGSMVDFVLDTETADIVLTPHDAQRIGIDPSSLIFDQQIETPDGPQSAASVQLSSLRIGLLVMEEVPARVSATGKHGNILGMTFLDRLSEWRIEENMLLVRQ